MKVRIIVMLLLAVTSSLGVMGKGNDADVRLLREAAEAIVSIYDSQKNLDVIEACGKWDPALTEYAIWRKKGEPDCREQRGYEALEHLLSVARSFPNEREDVKLAIAEINYLRITLTWNYHKRSEALNMLDDISETISDCNSLEAANTKMLYRATKCLIRRIEDGDSPLFWDEVNVLERELQGVLSVEHVEDYMLYQLLDVMSQMKSCSTEYVRYFNNVFNNDDLAKRGIAPDTRDNDMINSNSLWYVEEEKRVYKKHSPGELGNLAQTVLNEAVYVYNYHLAEYYEKVLDDISKMYNLLLQAGTRGRPYLALLENWKALFQNRTGCGVDNQFFMQWKGNAELIKSYYGDNSAEYIDYLHNVISVMYHEQRNSDITEVQKYLGDVTADQGYMTKEKELKYHIIDLWYDHTNMSDQEFRAHVSSIVDDYLTSHQPTWGWVETGKVLACRLSQEMEDNASALSVQKIVLEDTKKLLPPHHIQLAYEYRELINYLDPNQEELQSYYLHAMIDVLEANETSSPSQIRELAYCYLEINEKAKAESLFRKAIAEAHKNADKTMEAFCAIEMMAYIDDIPDNGDIVRKYSPVLESLNEYQYDAINVLMLAANYLLYINDVDQALSLYETGRCLLQKANVPQTTQTCNFYHDYAETYTYFRNDYDAALQLLEEAVALYEKGNFSDGFNEDLFKLQQLHFDLLELKGGGQDVLIKKLFCLKDLIDLAEKLYVLSGNSDEIRYTYMLDALNKSYFLFMTYYQVKNDLRNTPKDTDAYRGTESTLNTLNQILGDFTEESFDDLLAGFKEYDHNYRSNAKYYNILVLYASYCYNVAENFTKGNSIMLTVLKESKNHYPTGYPNYLYSYISVLTGQNRYAEAEKRLSEYEKLIDESVSPLDEQLKLTALKYDIYFNLGRYKDCIAPAKDNLDLMRGLIDINFDMLTQQERENILVEKGTGAGFITYLLEHCPKELAPTAYDAMLHEKNLLLRSSERVRRSVLKSGNKELMNALDSINTIQTLLRQNAGLGVESESNEEKMAYLSMQKHMEELERYVARLSAPYRNDRPMKVTWQDVRNKLDKNSAAIEIVLSQTQIGMVIITHELEAPVFVPLTSYYQLRTDLESLSALPSRQYAEALYKEDCLQLYERLWQPTEKYLKGIEKIYLSPTGITNTIAFNAIKTPDGKTLFEKYNISQLTTTAYVALPREKADSAFDAAIYGGILYDEEQQSETEEPSQLAHRGSRGADTKAFCFLNGTINEAQTVSDIMRQKGRVKVFSGMEATERAFASLSDHSPSLVHLATHGFFIPNDKMVEETPYLDRYPATKYQSMQRCGLAFANANEAWNGDTSQEFSNDGILNATEISTLELSNTRLVTMSACETALGDYGTDGVYGLQRGLKQAGVHSIMASLWSVDDTCTAAFMSSFYSIWTNGCPLQEALRNTITKIRQEYPSPYFWAAFILLDALD